MKVFCFKQYLIVLLKIYCRENNKPRAVKEKKKRERERERDETRRKDKEFSKKLRDGITLKNR